jgi:hypothetical protein
MVIPDASVKNASTKNEPWVLASQVDQCFFITDPSKTSRVVLRRGKRSVIRMEGPANEQDLEKNGIQRSKRNSTSTSTSRLLPQEEGRPSYLLKVVRSREEISTFPA